MILIYTTYTLFIFTLKFLQCVISLLLSACCNHLNVLMSYCLSYCLRFEILT